MNTNNFVNKLSELDSDSTSNFGGKASNLGELIKSGINVPPGFALSKDLYFDFIRNSDIQSTIEKILSNSESMGISELQKASSQIKNLIDKWPKVHPTINEVPAMFGILLGNKD